MEIKLIEKKDEIEKHFFCIKVHISHHHIPEVSE